MADRPETLNDILTEMREREVARGFKSKTLSDWAARIEAVGAQAAAAWRPMETAPRDGTILRLLVRFTEHPLDDASEADLVPTIGENNRDNTGEDVWQFAGWCWTHDHFTEGHGTPVGWLPMLSDSSPDLREVVAMLEDCVDSLEYVNRSHPEATGWGVRAERIEKSKVVLASINPKLEPAK